LLAVSLLWHVVHARPAAEEDERSPKRPKLSGSQSTIDINLYRFSVGHAAGSRSLPVSANSFVTHPPLPGLYSGPSRIFIRQTVAAFFEQLQAARNEGKQLFECYGCPGSGKSRAIWLWTMMQNLCTLYLRIEEESYSTLLFMRRDSRNAIKICGSLSICVEQLSSLLDENCQLLVFDGVQKKSNICQHVDNCIANVRVLFPRCFILRVSSEQVLHCNATVFPFPDSFVFLWSEWKSAHS
jgi:hypothetical protein